ncbi:MAG: hypothetical protein U0636_12060 [Phycisphaerales bacterium]
MITRVASLVCGAALLCGCETVKSETSDGRPMPPASRNVAPPPQDAPINAVSVLYGPKPTDSDANGRPDRLSIEIYLFAQPYPVPTWRDGTITIQAFRPKQAGTAETRGKHPLKTWRIPTSQLDLGRFRSLIGEGYRFQVSLLDDGGTDVLPVNTLDLVASFTPPSSQAAVWSDGVRSISFEPPEEPTARPGQQGGAGGSSQGIGAQR